MILLTLTAYLGFAGLTLTAAYEDLSYNKSVTQMHFYAHLPLYAPKNAVDRNISTCMRTNDTGKNSQFKTVWWKVDLGDVYSIYNINILFKNYENEDKRQHGRFAGFSLYVSFTGDIRNSILCYKDEPPLPPLNFTTTCEEHGRYVIFYNERLDGVSYPEGYELNNVFSELCEVIVKGCKKGVYGRNCEITCPINCKEGTCHIQNGTCLLCKPGWTGSICIIKCGVGWYGVNCSNRCTGHCRDEATCNHVTGQCDRGCAAGWTGTLCETACRNGTYGYDCVKNCSGHCLDGSPCNKQTGKCDMGCNPGYTNYGCNDVCSSRFFGSGCIELCSGHCTNNEPCDHVSGVCPSGCQDGYTGARCNSSCKEGYYGRHCSRVCFPNCKTCRHTDGQCSCVAGWMGTNCSKECIQSYGENCQYTCSKSCINQTCNRYNGTCEYEDSSISTFSSKYVTVSVGVIVGTSVCLMIGVAIAVLILRIKRQATQIKKRESIVLETKHHFTKEHRPPYETDDRYINNKANDQIESSQVSQERTKRGPPTNKNISVRNIKAQIANMSSNESAGFKSEYQDIPKGELHPCFEAKKLENKVKNRYTTIYSYDHSRVILKTSSSNEGDYINANYIEDARGKRLYIATQGPKPKTIFDFWTMVWQEEVCNIVCLTNLKEGTKNKCSQYWPDINDKLKEGTLTVRHLEEKTYAEYIIRRLKIHNNSTRADRHVTMFHYTTWSDHGVADPLSLVVFHRHMIRATSNSPGKFIVVHCSAGVGRTGTYIALDALFREGERTGKINVPMYVRTMRKDRMNMIQGDVGS